MLPGKLCMSELTSLPQKKLIPNKVTKFVWDYGSYHLFLELVSDELTTQKKMVMTIQTTLHHVFYY